MDILSCFKGKKGSIAACVSPLTSLMMDQRIKFSLKSTETEFVGKDTHNDDDPNKESFKRKISNWLYQS